MTDINKLDQLLNAARQRKVARGETVATDVVDPDKKAARIRLTDEEKASREKTKEDERAAKAKARDDVRQAKALEKAANKAPAHLKKVQRAAERLQPLTQAALLVFNEASASLTQAELQGLALHIQQFNRETATKRALEVRLAEGQPVRIVGGDPRHVGKTGVLSKVQRIRAYVAVDGAAAGSKPIYCFTSDCEPIAHPQAAATDTAAE